MTKERLKGYRVAALELEQLKELCTEHQEAPELRALYTAKIERAQAELQDVRGFVEQLPAGLLQDVARLHYLEGRTVWATAEALYYDPRTVSRYLAKIAKM